MKNIALLAAASVALISTPALAAGEGRVEARGGIAWAGGNSEAIAGIAGGYDFDLGDKAFAGVEVSADKLLTGGTDVLFGVGGRIGAKVGDNGKLYFNAGYSFGDGDAAHIGAGYQHKFGSKFYGKVEYRRYLNNGTDINVAGVGVGLAF
jgi:outer membrane immunogenic protein